MRFVGETEGLVLSVLEVGDMGALNQILLSEGSGFTSKDIQRIISRYPGGTNHPELSTLRDDIAFRKLYLLESSDGDIAGIAGVNVLVNGTCGIHLSYFKMADRFLGSASEAIFLDVVALRTINHIHMLAQSIKKRDVDTQITIDTTAIPDSVVFDVFATRVAGLVRLRLTPTYNFNPAVRCLAC